MKVIIRDLKETECVCDALIITLHEGEGVARYREIDSLLNGLLSKVVSSREFVGKHTQTSLIHTMNKIGPARILLIGLGKVGEISAEKLRQAGGKALSYLCGLGLKEIAFSSSHILSVQQSPVPFVEGGLLSLYQFKKYKKEEDASKEIERLTLIGKPEPSIKKSLLWTVASSSAVSFARDLVNAPSNDMTPTILAKAAESLAGGRVAVRVLEKRDAERLGMRAYLSVAKGSMEPPKFIVVRYHGGKGAPIALVGKSITFDSGGISIKPSEGMEKMKYDMAGGATVLAVVKAASEMMLPVNLLGVLPATENLPGGTASKPGDIVTSLSGKTIEIVNTDAEGRLVLADGIGYVKKFKPKVIIDIATLTGACGVALGNEAIAMMGNDVAIMERLKTIGDEVYERVWQMPLYEEYLDYIKSDVAELKNSGGRTGSLVTAAYFLKEFAGDTPWVHLDIAGTAWTEKDKPYVPKGATGIGVRLLLDLLREMK
ncbi:MAG TPA: leucyl aminopeptidase [Thermodesulfovibrionales bacterium]|nr:leucyl aminopeptidase [Thermodesulfovibrionales bacterium]